MLKKEIIYRASRRGTKELDSVFSPILTAHFLDNFSPKQLKTLRALLLETEYDLMQWLVETNKKHLPLCYLEVVAKISTRC